MEKINLIAKDADTCDSAIVWDTDSNGSTLSQVWFVAGAQQVLKQVLLRVLVGQTHALTHKRKTALYVPLLMSRTLKQMKLIPD